MPMTVSHRARAHIILVSVVVAFVLLLATATRAFAAGSGEAVVVPQHTTEHLVVPGDTLWEIASDNAGPGDDIRKAVFEIQQINGLPSSVIIPGQVLIVPLG